jgi:hypothetical protein
MRCIIRSNRVPLLPPVSTLHPAPRRQCGSKQGYQPFAGAKSVTFWLRDTDSPGATPPLRLQLGNPDIGKSCNAKVGGAAAASVLPAQRHSISPGNHTRPSRRVLCADPCCCRCSHAPPPLPPAAADTCCCSHTPLLMSLQLDLPSRKPDDKSGDGWLKFVISAGDFDCPDQAQMNQLLWEVKPGQKSNIKVCLDDVTINR